MDRPNATISLEIEQMTAHLTILGYWPTRVKLNYGRRTGIRNHAQLVWWRYGRVYFDTLEPHWVYSNMEWWELTDEVIRAFARSLDNTLVGW
jgi:hypothetical protein